MVAVAAVAAGCAGEPGQDVDTSTTAQALATDCNSEGPCPTNSPVIATLPFYNLYVIPNQQDNDQHFRITGFFINGVPHTLRVIFGRISGAGPTGLVEHEDLWRRHAEIRILNTDTLKTYALQITDVDLVDMWANSRRPQPPHKIEAYWMKWSELDSNGVPLHEYTDLCKEAELPEKSIDLNYGSSSVKPHLTFVFEGELIDAKARTIDNNIDLNWFNLGCAGHALAKMYLMGHVRAAAPLGYVTTLDERRAILKMFSADYCNSGYAFTLPGVPLQWEDHRGWFKYTGLVGDIEARWTPLGVTCLTLPRVMANWKNEYFDKWPNGIIPEIQARCPGLISVNNRCQNPPTGFFGVHLVTGSL